MKARKIGMNKAIEQYSVLIYLSRQQRIMKAQMIGHMSDSGGGAKLLSVSQGNRQSLESSSGCDWRKQQKRTQN